MSAVAAPSTVKFHLSLNVADLERSVEFFAVLFGREAAKCRPDYAKFELEEPPVVLSLEPHAPVASGALNHLGFRLGDSAELVAWQRRLEMAGISTEREEGVECCYARQTKFWVRDPDNNLWEIYVLEEDIEHRGLGQVPEALPQMTRPTPISTLPAQSIWQHQLGSPLPLRIYAPDGSTSEARLRGSFNTPHTRQTRRQLLGEVFRILSPGGAVALHMLTGNKDLTTPPGTLPGPASVVTHVPSLEELLDDLLASGFEGIQLTKYGSRPCFTHSGTELRETMLTARRPEPEHDGQSPEVVYLGPLAAVRDDEGQEYPRGRRVKVTAAKSKALATGSLAQSFACLEQNNPGAACGA
jgi:catechol 2,3-dioxygenase-like lactoylglutathione lyase family enzyme